jgi:hypothetical protein
MLGGAQYGTSLMLSFVLINFEMALRFLENLCTAVLISFIFIITYPATGLNKYIFICSFVYANHLGLYGCRIAY